MEQFHTIFSHYHRLLDNELSFRIPQNNKLVIVNVRELVYIYVFLEIFQCV